MKFLKGITYMLATIFCVASMAACGGSTSGGSTDGGSTDGGSTDGGNINTENGGSTAGDENEDDGENVTPQPDAATVRADNLVKNFWESDTMYDETVMLIAPTDENGEITGLPSGKLLFNADEIVEVKQYFHANNQGIVTYKEDVDFDYANGVITAKGTIQTDIYGNKTEVDTTMPYVTDRQWKGIDAFPGLSTSSGIPSTEGDWQIPYTESYQIVQMQLSVTYRHSDTWEDVTPAYQGNVLSNVVNKLKNKQDTEILIFGDSISTGANSSSILNIEPYLKPWYNLMEEKLERHYGAKVTLTNKAVGGWTSTDGVNTAGKSGWMNGTQITQAGLPTLMAGELKDYVPDLAIIGFGMNDATLGVDLNTYAKNIRKMIDCIRERNPDCDIILLGTMLANSQAKDQYKNQTEFSALNKQIARYYYDNTHIACVDIGEMHQALLDNGKKYIDMTGNNVNHPNDFIARIYAMNLLSTLIEE
ncbi:MAG: hypothetical protein IJ329_02465 [Clostridia bacterium]|nr:hypothetical protein [Clostridia bacterium]